MGDFYTRLCANVIFPLHERLKGHRSVAMLRELMRTQWYDRERLQRLQLERLRGLLAFAGEHVPYYRETFARARFDPRRVERIEDLRRLPILTKDIIRVEGDRMGTEAAKRLPWQYTTGSTGNPLRFKTGIGRKSADVAAKWRATRWWGVDIGDPEIVCWSSPIEIKAQDRLRELRDRLLRTRTMSTMALTTERMDEVIAEIRRMRPKMLFGYPSSLALVAQRAIERGIDLTRQGIKVAFATAERLYPYERDWIERGFGCPVANGYGGRDSGFIAHQCPHGGLHITAEDMIVEIVDEQGRPLPPGEPGEVLITHLHSHDFPFIRFKNGDIAALDDTPCLCGRGLPLIKEIQGRSLDLLYAHNGARVHAVTFGALLRRLPGMRQFKVIQESLERIRLQLVVTDEFDARAAMPKIVEQFRYFLGPVQVEPEFLDRIEPEPTGKYAYVVTRIKTPPQAPAAGSPVTLTSEV
ncbi:MAG: phenylacetate--CoA ligase family protein [Burkholderiales bacterium]|nr:phenylacetate--CoA ligase family protein [Burkholderiales bacterium]